MDGGISLLLLLLLWVAASTVPVRKGAAAEEVLAPIHGMQVEAAEQDKDPDKDCYEACEACLRVCDDADVLGAHDSERCTGTDSERCGMSQQWRRRESHQDVSFMCSALLLEMGD